jgi:hypothetical protein
MKEFGVVIFGVASLWLLVWILVLGFQTRSLVDVFGSPFDYFESAGDIFLAFLVPLILVLGFAVLVFSLMNTFGSKREN